MKHYIIHTLVWLGTAILITPAHAAVQEVTNAVVVPYGLSALENGVSFGQSWTNLSAPCVSNNLVYIAPEDKQMYATLLSAQVAGLHVSMRYEDNATPVTLGAWPGVTLRCKALAVWINKLGY